jgi:hypothetical protein
VTCGHVLSSRIAESLRAADRVPAEESLWGGKGGRDLVSGQLPRGYGLFACSGILFNHASSLRPSRFVTRKITAAAANIGAGSRERLALAISRSGGTGAGLPNTSKRWGECCRGISPRRHPYPSGPHAGDTRVNDYGLANAVGRISEHRPGGTAPRERPCHAVPQPDFRDHGCRQYSVLRSAEATNHARAEMQREGLPLLYIDSILQNREVATCRGDPDRVRMGSADMGFRSATKARQNAAAE